MTEPSSSIAAGVAATATGAWSAFSWAAVNQAPIPFLGVPLIVVAMSATGALLSFAVGQPLRSRRQMFKMALVNTFVGATLTGLIPVVADLTWAQGAEGSRLLPPLALLVSLSLRFLLPIAIDLMPAAARGALKRFFGIEAALSPDKESTP